MVLLRMYTVSNSDLEVFSAARREPFLCLQNALVARSLGAPRGKLRRAVFRSHPACELRGFRSRSPACPLRPLGTLTGTRALPQPLRRPSAPAADPPPGGCGSQGERVSGYLLNADKEKQSKTGKTKSLEQNHLCTERGLRFPTRCFPSGTRPVAGGAACGAAACGGREVTGDSGPP